MLTDILCLLAYCHTAVSRPYDPGWGLRKPVKASFAREVPAAETTLTNIKAHEVVSETVKNSLQRATLFATIFSATLAQVKPSTKFSLFGDNEMVSPETISTRFARSVLPPKRPNLVRGFTWANVAEKMVAKRVALCREFLTVSETTSWAFMFVSESYRNQGHQRKTKHQHAGSHRGMPQTQKQKTGACKVSGHGGPWCCLSGWIRVNAEQGHQDHHTRKPHSD